MKKMQLKLMLGLTALLLANVAPAQAAKFDIDASHSVVRFQVKHLTISKVNGSFGDVSGTFDFEADDPANWRAEATIGIASVDTDNDKRDDHLRSADFFDAGQFPTMTFKSTGVEMKDSSSGLLMGDLTMRGITRPVTLKMEFNGEVTDPWGNERAGFSLTGEINRKDWNLTYNSTLESGGLLIGEEVKITLEVEGVKAK